MTTNAFVFSWDQTGIDAIVPITQYEQWDQENLMRILKDEAEEPNPLNRIINHLILRAKYNSHRHYEIYVIDCTEELDEEFWRDQWRDHPQATADLIRERGIKLYSDRATRNPVIS